MGIDTQLDSAVLLMIPFIEVTCAIFALFMGLMAITTFLNMNMTRTIGYLLSGCSAAVLGANAPLFAAALFGQAPPQQSPPLPPVPWSTTIGNVALYVVGALLAIGCIYFVFTSIKSRRNPMLPRTNSTTPLLPATPLKALPHSLPTHADALIASIKNTIVVATAACMDTGSEAAFNLHEIETRYLPDTVNAYQAIPNIEGFDWSAIDNDLVNQLERIKSATIDAATAVARNATEKLTQNGLFVQERFETTAAPILHALPVQPEAGLHALIGQNASKEYQ